MKELEAVLAAAGFTTSEAADRRVLFERVMASWTDLVSGAPELAYHVPGRIEVLGKHTDYAGGRSLVTATAQGFAVLAAPREDSHVRLVDALRGEERSFSIHADLAPHRNDWSNYPMTVAARLARDFGIRRGIDLVFASDLPYAAGVSSSSALVVANVLGLIDANDLAASPEFAAAIPRREALAEYCGAVENGGPFRSLGGGEGVGTMGGSQDQTAILCAQPNAVVQYRFDPVRFEQAVRWPDQWIFAVGASGVVAEKTGAAQERYNDLARLTARLTRLAAEETGQRNRSLGDLLLQPDDRHRARLIDRVAKWDGPEGRALEKRLVQLTTEISKLIPGFGASLARADQDSLGGLAESSFRLAELGLNNQIPETRVLRELAMSHGAIAASPFGAGFGGSVWAIVERTRADHFVQAWLADYLTRFPEHAGAARVMLTRPAPAAIQLVRVEARWRVR